jgi:hypothetical protein
MSEANAPGGGLLSSPHPEIFSLRSKLSDLPARGR